MKVDDKSKSDVQLNQFILLMKNVAINYAGGISNASPVISKHL